jgi:hypothetical protein
VYSLKQFTYESCIPSSDIDSFEIACRKKIITGKNKQTNKQNTHTQTKNLTLYPLSSFGLWLAVTITPHLAP